MWLLSSECARTAAVFDGHSGFSAAKYLSDNLYQVFSDAIDENIYGQECSVDGMKLLMTVNLVLTCFTRCVTTSL